MTIIIVTKMAIIIDVDIIKTFSLACKLFHHKTKLQNLKKIQSSRWHGMLSISLRIICLKDKDKEEK